METIIPVQISASTTPRTIHEYWLEITLPEAEWIDRRFNRLLHAIVSRYGISREEACRQILDFIEQQSSGQSDSRW